jgi:hypothetical protein
MNESPRCPAGAPEAGITRITINQETRVGWFYIRQLFFTGVKVLSSTIVGSMSDRREIMAALDQPSSQSVPLDYSHDDDIWIDYVGDTGDGWESTSSVAHLVGRDRLWLRDYGKQSPQPISPTQAEAEPSADQRNMMELPAGSILIFGGDQVCPVASANGYQFRLIDP